MVFSILQKIQENEFTDSNISLLPVTNNKTHAFLIE